MGRNISELLVEGINNPSEIPRFLRRKKREAMISLKYRSLTPHDRKIHDTLKEEEEFLLVIFDACRYDYFREIFENHYRGELSRTYTTNTFTMQYLSGTWVGDYDITYVAGGPVISDRRFEISGIDYVPSKHFDRIIDAWNMGYDLELGVLPPEAVTNAAMDCDASRMVVHFFQPHAPYIGDVRLRTNGATNSSEEQSRVERMKTSTREIYDQIEQGQISNSKLKSAYRSNLDRVMEAAKPLVQESTCRTILTADHGELLGEDGRYMHGGLPHPILSELPWFEVEGIKGEVNESDFVAQDTETGIEDQLEALGYL